MGLGVREIIGDKKQDILRLAKQYDIEDIRVFGSVVRNEADEKSDVDLLLNIRKSTFFKMLDFKYAVEDLLKRKVDVVSDRGPKQYYWSLYISGGANIMRNPPDKVFIMHILQAINEINEFVGGDKNKIYNDLITKRAVSKDFEIIGEAGGRVSEVIKQKYPNVPWRKIKDFRNAIVHDYWDVDYIAMWELIENDLPGLKIQMEKILSEIDA